MITLRWRLKEFTDRLLDDKDAIWIMTRQKRIITGSQINLVKIFPGLRSTINLESAKKNKAAVDVLRDCRCLYQMSHKCPRYVLGKYICTS